MTTIENTLAERGARYGDFRDHAVMAQALQDDMRHRDYGWDKLNSVQKQALTVIADKIARILTGDPNYADNWHDIQGYAKLVEERLNAPPPPPKRCSQGAVADDEYVPSIRPRIDVRCYHCTWRFDAAADTDAGRIAINVAVCPSCGRLNDRRGRFIDTHA
jgi:hypothetical protein